MSTDNQLLEALQRSNAKQTQLAGQRYTPGVEPGAPNLQITPLLLAVNSAACGTQARERFLQFVATLRKAWSRAKSACDDRDAIQVVIDSLERTVDMLFQRMLLRDVAALFDWREQLAAIAASLITAREKWHDEERKATERDGKQPSGPRSAQTSERDSIRSSINEISQCIGLLDDERTHIESPAGAVLADPFLLITGVWGTGKTHFLCDTTRLRECDGRPTLLILAKSFQGAINLIPAISSEVLVGTTPEELIDDLQRLGVNRGERSLIIVDGINEGRRNE